MPGKSGPRDSTRRLSDCENLRTNLLLLSGNHKAAPSFVFIQLVSVQTIRKSFVICQDRRSVCPLERTGFQQEVCAEPQICI